MIDNEKHLTDFEKQLEMLQQVEAAIYAIMVGGQSYKIGSRSLTRADLSELRRYKNELTAQMQNEDDGLLGNTAVAFFDRR